MKKNTKPATPAPETKALTVPERAVAALGYNPETTKELTTLAKSSASITAITNKAGYDQCHAARMVLKTARLEITKRGKTAREDAQKFGKAVIAEENRLIALIEPEELRLQKLQDEHDAAIEAEELRKQQIEIERVNGIQARIERIRRMVDLPVNPVPQYVLDRILEAEAVEIDESFEEFEQAASDAKGAALNMLRQAHKDAEERVAKEEQARKDREENERLRRQLEEMQAAERERQRQDEERRQAEERAERDRLAEQRGREMAQAADQRLREVEKQPIVAHTIEPGEKVAVRFVTPDQPAIVDAGAEIAKVTAPRIRPTLEEMATVLANHYETDEGTVLNWLDRAIRGTSRAA